MNAQQTPGGKVAAATSAMEVLLGSLGELLRSQREILESMKRIERDLLRIRARLDAPSPEAPPPRTESRAQDAGAGTNVLAGVAISDESLLRAIEGALRADKDDATQVED